MASSTSTFATLRALHLVIRDALDDIQRVFSQNIGLSSSPGSQCPSPVYPCPTDLSPMTSPFPTTPPASFPPTPLSATFPHTDMDAPFVDYPSPDLPHDPDSLGEQLALHPDAVAAASRIVAACGQLSNIVHKPFSSLCDAILSYNLPACMRLVEHLHVAEIIREAEETRQHSHNGGQRAATPPYGIEVDPNIGPGRPSPCDIVDIRQPANGTGSHPQKGTEGLHVTDIASVICSYAGANYVGPNELVHILRLLSTHHIFRETSPDTFALTRVASLLDSGKSVKAAFSSPGTKYDDTDGIAAFVALTTDELFKSAAYLTEAFTGVQLPTLAVTPNTSFHANTSLSGKNAIHSTSGYLVNDLAPTTTRSSSAITHIVYPEDGTTQPPYNAESLGHVGLLSVPTDVQMASQSLAPESQVPLSTHPIPIQALTWAEKQHPQSGDASKPEKFLAFNLAFHTNTPFFEWLENGGEDPLGGTGLGARMCMPTKFGICGDSEPNCTPEKPFRLQRFSKAMMGTTGWEAPKAILSGFDWYSLPKGSTIVDVGGGIGSTTMTLARVLNGPRLDLVKRRDGASHNEEPTTFSHRAKLPSDPSLMAGDVRDDMNLRFVVQDRPVVTTLGIEAWRSKCPDMLDSGQVTFQDQDFFEPQLPFEPPHLTRHPAVYVLRVVLHDWPDEVARRILINLRVASNPETRLLIAEHVLPLACIDEDILDHMNTVARVESGPDEWTVNSVLAHIEGAERTLVPPPLLANMGKASANAYWMDLTMHITLNVKERTLREFCGLALSAGWRVARMTRPEGSLFAYLVCEPIPLPDDAQAIYNAVVLSSELSTIVVVPPDEPLHRPRVGESNHKLPVMPLLPSPVLERSSSRCGTPTFGSRVLLPKDEELQSPRARSGGLTKKWLKSKGLGVRGVMMQKAEKQKEGQSLSNSISARSNSEAQTVAPASPSHVRVWWKKSPPNSTRNSGTATHESNSEVPAQRTAKGGRKWALKPSETPSTPSPRPSPVHQKWPSIESTALSMLEISPPVLDARRSRVASITRRLSFATFRRPSVADIPEPLPTPPPLMELAPPPTLHGDTGRRLKHLPSLPTLGRNKATTTGRSTAPRRPSLSSASLARPNLVPASPRRHNATDSPRSGILESHPSPHPSKQSSPEVGSLAGPTPPLIPRRQRRVTLSNAPGAPLRTHPPMPASVNPDSAVQVKRIPSVPMLPRRLSIPALRRKQSQSVMQDAENNRV